MLKNKAILILALVILLFTGFYLIRAVRNPSVDLSNQAENALWDDYEIESRELDGKMYRLIRAEKPAEQQQGLMYVRKPAQGFDGMVFEFSEEQVRTFWNKNTFVDLKLYWIQNSEVIGTSDLPSIETSGDIVRVRSPGPVDEVVEVIQ